MWEKIVASTLIFVLIASSVRLGLTFQREHSQVVPASGGSFVEGVAGEVQFLNPLLAQTDLDRDVSSLLFCGLKKYDPVTASIVDDVASHTLSSDKRTYTFTIKENAKWHDGQPVTADDIVFTFGLIQSPDFPNPALSADFAGVTVKKLDDRTATLTLAKPYAFFIFNSTVGLLPKHLLESVPPGELLAATDFNINHPVGCGPYQIVENSPSQIRLAAFEDYFAGRPKLDQFIFRVFPNTESIFKNISSVNGTQALTASQSASLASDSRLTVQPFSLPQYVAVFFNTQSGVLRDKKTRLGLQLATNKQEIADTAGDAKVIDTPFLEIAQADWQYQFDAARADGALYDAGWRYPSKNAPAAAPAANPNADSTGAFISQPSSARYFATPATEFFISGSVPAGISAVKVNGFQLTKFAIGSTTFSFNASVALGTLKDGEQDFVVTVTENGTDRELDRITILRSMDEAARTAWLASKQAATPAAPAPAPANLDPELRYNSISTPLKLTLLAPDFREEYAAAADIVAQQWKARGVTVEVVKAARDDFFARLQKRDYDAVIFGQNLGYNLDTYPFWHSSQTGAAGNNLSNLRSLTVNTWLEQARASFDASERTKRIASLRDALANEVPAVFLYTPMYHYAIESGIRNFNLGQIALERDRLAGAAGWYLREDRVLNENVGVGTFFGWLWANL